MTGMSDLLDGQALWDYDAAGKVVRPPAVIVTAQQQVAFAAMAFNPNQRRGPDGRWISMGGGLPGGDGPALGGASEEDDELYRELRSEYGWDLHQAADGVWQASRERETDPDPRWLEADPQWEAGDGDVILRKLMRNLEWDLEDQPELADAAMERLREHIEAEYPGAVADLPEPPERGALAQLHPRADASDGYRGAQAAHADALTEALRSGVAAQKSLSAGFMGDTRLLTLNDGSQVVYKRAISTLRPEDLDWQIKDQTDAEHLSSLLAGAVGAPAPVVHRLNDAEVVMELVPGRPADASGLTDARRRGILATDDAVRLGLLDVLLNNTDRHGGNWMVDDAGGPVGIDHGMAFSVDPPAGTSGATKSPFAAEHFINPDGTFKATNSLTRSDITRLEGEIERIRPQFERAGRTDWLDAALGRLRQLGEHARGSAVTAAQHAAFTLATQRAAFALFAFNPHQRRGPDGKWIKMGSGAPGSGLGRQVTVHHSIPFDGDIQSAIMESRFGDGLVELPAITVPEDEAAAAPAGGRRSIMLRVKVGADQPATDAGGGRIALPAGQVRVTDTDWVDNPDGSRTWIVDATYEGPATDAPAVVPPATVEDFDSATSGRAVWDAIPSSSSKVQDAAATYAGPSFREINGFLRGTSDYEYTGMGDDIKTLSDGINRNRLSTPAVVWRGIGSGARMLGSTYFDRPDLTGVEWEDPAFVSTTADEEVLIRERLVRPGGDSVKMRVLLPGGTGAIRVGQWEYEAEMLLDKGNRYRIVRDRGMVDGIRQLDVEVVPRGDQ